ncbi:lachesin [Eurytemora carolleeae]|uniref:lachesin n=1 Tax=Eurytemora carolleeae TaxID=1294199 RepID=UPI000C779357|nr:lachesin [Eurytemora carolleeae]|eukprot:XP_023340721.1 lachesin-like [Eurytemora affinis]
MITYSPVLLTTIWVLLVQTTTGGSLSSDLYQENLEAPLFLNSSETSIVSSVGQTSYLYCGVSNLGDRAVSWIRSRDLTILTIGMIRYTRDNRFTAIHAEGNNFWGLKILSPRVEDSGLYECQVSYHDDVEKKLKLPFTLTVLESRARILGNQDIYMREGSAVELECGIENIPAPPAYIYWYKENSVISYSATQGIVLSLQNSNNTLISKLTIKSASPADSGNYTCAPANALTDSVFLNVVKGEKQEGLRESSDSSNLQRLGPAILLFICFVPSLW